MAAIHSTRAMALVGAPFRPQGRCPGQGLDCVGLCLVAYDLPLALARTDYRLRGSGHQGEIERAILPQFRRVGPAQRKAGDMLLMLPAANQAHLGILTPRGFVHADARLRRVVEVPGEPHWPVAATFRLRGRSGR